MGLDMPAVALGGLGEPPGAKEHAQIRWSAERAPVLVGDAVLAQQRRQPGLRHPRPSRLRAKAHVDHASHPGGAQLGHQSLGQQALIADRPQARHAGSFARPGRIPRHGLSPAGPLRPARLGPDARHHDLRRRRRLREVGTIDVDGARRRIDLCLDAGVNFIDTADVYSDGVSEEIIGQALGRPARSRAARDQGAHADGGGAQRRGPLAPPPHRGVRGEPAAPAHRPHRPLPGPRMGRRDAAGGDAGRARHARARGQGALRRRLELRRLAAR